MILEPELLQIDNLVTYLQNEKQDSEFSRYLRSIPEEEAYCVIQKLISYNPKLGLLFAKRSLKTKSYFHKLLQQGLNEADASSLKYWLDCCISRLGFFTVALIIKNIKPYNPEGFKKALYWLPIYVPKDSHKAKKLLSSLYSL